MLHGIFKRIETKRRCFADYIGSNSSVATQVGVTVFIMWSLLLRVYRLFDMNVMSCLRITHDLNHSSVHLGMYNVKYIELLANHRHLLPSLRSAMPIQIERSVLRGGGGGGG